MGLSSLGKILITIGCVAIVVGLFLLFGDRVPGLGRLGRLPGDLYYEKDSTKIYFSATTSLLISVILSILFWIFRSRS